MIRSLRPWLLLLPCWLLTLAGPILAQTSLEDSPDELESPDADLEDLLESLEGAPPQTRIDALEEYLETHPGSPRAAELRERIQQEKARLTPAPRTMPHSATRLLEPIRQPSVDPGQQARAHLELGAPAWYRFSLGYDHPLTQTISLGGSIGVGPNRRLVQADGRYLLRRTPRNDGILSAQLGLLAELGTDSRVQLEPRLVYAGWFHPVRLQATLNPRLQVTGLELRYQGALAVGMPVGSRLWLELETHGDVKRVVSIRTDLPTPMTETVGFWAVTAGARAHINARLDMALGVSLPLWYAYQVDYELATTLQVYYRLDGKKPSR